MRAPGERYASRARTARGMAITIVPSLGLQPEPGVDMRPMPRSREIFASVRRGSAANPAVAAVLDALQGRAAETGLMPRGTS